MTVERLDLRRLQRAAERAALPPDELDTCRACLQWARATKAWIDHTVERLEQRVAKLESERSVGG